MFIRFPVTSFADTRFSSKGNSAMMGGIIGGLLGGLAVLGLLVFFFFRVRARRRTARVPFAFMNSRGDPEKLPSITTTAPTTTPPRRVPVPSMGYTDGTRLSALFPSAISTASRSTDGMRVSPTPSDASVMPEPKPYMRETARSTTRESIVVSSPGQSRSSLAADAVLDPFVDSLPAAQAGPAATRPPSLDPFADPPKMLGLAQERERLSVLSASTTDVQVSFQ